MVEIKQCPEMGEIRKNKDLGLKGTNKSVWQACEVCEKERWVLLKKGQPVSLRCISCSLKTRLWPRGVACHSWKGGKLVTIHGYIYTLLQPGDFFYSMAYRSYVYEHRLVVAKALGRCLHSWEIVHHKHAKYPAGSIGDKQDNRYPENLQLVTDERHNQITILENRIKHLEERLKAYEKKL